MKKIRYIFEAIIVRLLIGIFKILPVDKASNLGGFLGQNVAKLFVNSKKSINNISLCLEVSRNDAVRIYNLMWENLGRNFAEYSHLQQIYTTRCDLINPQNLTSVLSNPNQPAIFFSGHIANWEVAAPSLRQQNIDVDLIYRAPNNPYVKDILDKCRSIDGTLKTYPKSAAGMRQVITALKQGRKIGILIDQKYNQGIEVPFFGHPAMTSLAFIQLAKKFNCPLIPVQVERQNGANFKVTIHPPMDLSKDDNTLILEAHNLLESWILKMPEHWLWLHKRWKV
jgi:KDO2-lipid IV(A) lauroyltransferase